MELTKCKLGELITQRREKNDGSDLPICGVSKDGLIPPKQIDADTSIYNVFYRDDFIFNPARMELNSIAINDRYDRAICSSLYEVFYVHRTDLLLPHYLKLIVKQPWFTRYCEFLGQGSAREYCRFNNISEIEVEFPSVKEQQKVIDYYASIQKRIEIKKQINDNLESQALAYYKLTVRNCSKNEIIEGSVGEIGEFVRGKNITAAEMIEGNIPVISAGLLPSGMHNAYNVKGPSITVSGSGVNAGYVSFHQNDIWAADCSYNNSSNFIHCLYVILKDIQSQITELQKGTAQPHVYPKELNPFAIKYPEKSIMIKLEESLKAFFTMIEENNSEIKALQEIQTHFLSVLSR